MKLLLTITHRHIIWFLVCTLLVGTIGGVLLFERHFQGKFYPNIIVGGERVGGKSYDEVLSRVRLVGEALKANGVQLVVPTDHTTTTIMIPQRSIGLTPDIVVEYFTLGDYEAAVKEAYQFGRKGSLLNRLREQFDLTHSSAVFTLPLELRETAVESLLEREFDTLLKKTSDARFIRKNGAIDIIPEVEGERIDIRAVIPALSQALTGMKTNRLQLRVIPQLPLITKNKLSTILDFVNDMSGSLTVNLEYPGGSFPVGGATVATWLSMKPEPGVSIIVQRASIADFIRRNINSRIDNVPKNSRFAMRDGKLIEIAPGAPGTAASIDALARSLEQLLMQRYLMSAFPAGSAMEPTAVKRETVSLPLSFIQEDPRITSSTVAQFKINDLVGIASTSFKGSTASRKHNIETGVERVSGLLIAPGEEFSLVKAIGEVTEETGFEKEYVIKNDRSVKEAGGGLCQLATTVFRAAMNAGLKITERQNHSYVVGYYGPGLDATIYGPHPDLRFVNDTGEYLLFQMRTSGDNLIAEFYGKKDGRVVTISQPKLTNYINPPPDRYLPALDKPWGQQECTDHARKGLTAEAVYTVQYDDGQVATQVFKSVYQPWPKICLVGIKLGQ